MLPDHVRELLAAAVDGELSPADRDRCRRLRAESPAADALYRRLKADRDRVRALPMTLPPAGLHDRIMAALGPPAPPAAPARPAAPKRDRRVLWAALAASVAVAAGTAVLVLPRKPGPSEEVAVQVPPKRPAPPTRLAERKPTPPPDAPAPDDILPEPRPAPTPILPPAPPSTLAVGPRPVERDLSAFPPVAPVAGFARARIGVPFLAPVADLAADDRRLALAEALVGHAAVRVDLFAKDPARGVEVFQAAAKEAGLGVQSEPVTQDRLNRRIGTAYLVYTEDLTADEVVGLLARLAAADAESPPAAFDKFHAGPVGQADAKELKDVLGVDPVTAKRAADPKPLSAGTAAQLTKKLAGGKDGEKGALLVTLAPTPARTPPTSRDIRQFLDGRGPRKPGAVPALFVVRLPHG